MTGESDLTAITARCTQVTNSPYITRETPADLKQLREVLDRVRFMITTDVPALTAEVRRLRLDIKRLQAETQSAATRHNLANVNNLNVADAVNLGV